MGVAWVTWGEECCHCQVEYRDIAIKWAYIVWVDTKLIDDAFQRHDKQIRFPNFI